jgi:hypothetical protein
MIDGTLRIDAAIASTFRGRGSSVIKAVIATGCTTCRARATRSGGSSGSTPATGCRRDETAGDERADRDRRCSPTADERPRLCSISAFGSAARVASTNHASSGPESSAR